MPTPPDGSMTPARTPRPAGPGGRRVVLVAGSGRSGTSTFAGALQHLGLHVPKPEVTPDETNPRGFGESQWVVDFHNELLARAVVHVSDARPHAWTDTGRLATRGPIQQRLTRWLSHQAEGADELVIKDPRLAWFLELWRDTATRCDVAPRFATMLRPPMEVVGSKLKAYGDRHGDINTMAAWVNMMLHTERATRDSVRVFIRYHDLLGDWTGSVFRAGDVLGLRRVQEASDAAVDRVHRFIDPTLRRTESTWDDFDGPTALRDLARTTWETLDGLADPEGDTPAAHETLDALREEYDRLYADAEAIAQSSATAAARRARLRAERASASGSAHSGSTRLRTMLPRRLRSAARRAIDIARARLGR